MNNDDNQLKRGMNLSLVGIGFFMAFLSIVYGPAMTGYIRALHTSDITYSIIITIPTLGGAFQILASYIMEHTGKRKNFIVIFGLIQRLIWIFIAFVPFVFLQESNQYAMWIAASLIAISSACGSIYQIAFTSWMGDYIPEEQRGNYYGKRIIICSIVAVAINLLAGKLLDSVGNFTGFAIVFSIAAILGIVDSLIFLRIEDPPMKINITREPFVKLFIKPLTNKKYLRLIIAVTCWLFGYNLSTPFYNVYMLEYVKLSYFQISILSQIAATLCTILFARYWGKWIDRFKNKSVIIICCSVMAFTTWIWCLVTPKSIFFIVVINLLIGLTGPGFEIASVNLSIKLAPIKNRSVYISVFALVTQIAGIALANICGGALLQYSKPILEKLNLPFIMNHSFTNYDLLFILSGILMLSSVFLFFRAIHELDAISTKSAALNFLNRHKNT